ncbi:hypothetical protein CMQ_4040 [Grosmannia clavigera kw1407]|uniref:2-oxoadipate dioxygenase/decarboxylase n=1 Tax=Grosmannia clavigera (strain kw1407 / UAMH 11150) TaxID=655863 RepID=F0X9K9_GROCL|nr:uncharacterized protein CMQ_4040 [Grosmannia clavigera kw1407]EFX05971.1 hypothetical protein CMQ_4040 [Grosmannia clavigera kw1407]
MASVAAADRTVSPTELRHSFSLAMSKIYQDEVPLYSDLLRLVFSVNATVLSTQPLISEKMQATNQLDRLHYERHGAIRLGTAEELALMARFFALMGMEPVGYYDLAQPPANLPIHATCFCCLDLESLLLNPFRMFVSLLRPELISSPTLRSKALSILSRRKIFSSRALELMVSAESRGGLLESQAEEFVHEGLKPFRWSGKATVSQEEYRELQEESPLLADIVGFPGPHINHLTPRTLDIDAVQRGMEENHIPMKDLIEGPPARKCDILLRQTSFQALEEKVYFPVVHTANGDTVDMVLGSHTARFGEIEQRGAALTAKGRQLYDSCVTKAWMQNVTAADTQAYGQIFEPIPDSWEELRTQKLAYFRYYPVVGATKSASDGGRTIENLVQQGKVAYEPLTYEEFLPLSAAGIFQSNLKRKGSSGSEDSASTVDDGGIETLQMALGKAIIDEFGTYKKLQDESLTICGELFGASSI